jgi:hypothetical protein
LECLFYNEPSIIFGAGAATWLKLTSDLQATITLKVVPFRAYEPFPAFLPFFKRILEVVFSEDVQHRLRFCLDNLNCVKMAAFQFHFQSEKQTKVGCLGDDSHVFGQKFIGEN